MSYSIDVNVLLYASDLSSSRSASAQRFLQERAADPDLCCLTWLTLMGYVRIATHPSVARNPLTPTEALANVHALLALPRVVTISEQDNFLDAYRETTRDLVVRGKLVPDAHLATILRQNGVRTLYTADADFTRFRFLDVRNPFE